MTWIQTYSGRDVDLLEPKLAQIYMGDIVHALARINRFTGHTVGNVPYSVAVHSVHVYRIARKLEPDNATGHLVALLHDAAEAYTGDLGTPLQEALGLRRADSVLHQIAEHFDRLIFARVGVPWAKAKTAWPLVKRADLMALQGERALYMSDCSREWRLPRCPREKLIVSVPRPRGPAAGERLFVRTYDAALKAWRGLTKLAGPAGRHSRYLYSG